MLLSHKLNLRMFADAVTRRCHLKQSAFRKVYYFMAFVIVQFECGQKRLVWKRSWHSGGEVLYLYTVHNTYGLNGSQSVSRPFLVMESMRLMDKVCPFSPHSCFPSWYSAASPQRDTSTLRRAQRQSASLTRTTLRAATLSASGWLASWPVWSSCF